jgi:transposase, IS30 family
MKYQQLTSEERYMLSCLKTQGLKQAEIARQLGRNRSTITRELQRNCCSNTDSCYRPSKAHARAISRRSRSRRNQQYTEQDYEVVKQLLSLDWSPEQIVGHCDRSRVPVMSHETIYRYIWNDKSFGGDLWKHLRQSTKQRRKRRNSYDSRGKLANKRMIAERPLSVEMRRIMGHWEIDTVHGRGSNHCIVTLTERKSGFQIIGKLKNKSTEELNNRVIQLLERHPGCFKSITADNGTEFHQYKKIEEATCTTFYFANPHHSWERGTNENTNGLIRQYLPKGKSMASLTQHRCNSIANRLNQRPRKRLDYKTPEEVFYGI